jgi:iron-sulfur cluster assembly protein
MLTLTENAVRHVQRFLRFSGGEVKGLRVAVTGGGCAGLQYKIDLAKEREPDDEVLELSGVTVFLDQQSVPYLDDLTIDFRETITESGFVFNNPKSSGACGCGKSFSA